MQLKLKIYKCARHVPVEKRGRRGIGARHVTVVPFALSVRSLVLMGRHCFLGQAVLGRGLFLVNPGVMFQFLLGQVAGQRAVATIKTA